jgi:hypothetical protein
MSNGSEMYIAPAPVQPQGYASNSFSHSEGGSSFSRNQFVAPSFSTPSLHTGGSSGPFTGGGSSEPFTGFSSQGDLRSVDETVNLLHQQQNFSRSIMSRLSECNGLFSLPMSLPKECYSHHYLKAVQPKATKNYYNVTQVFTAITQRVVEYGRAERGLRLPSGKETSLAASIACGEWNVVKLADLLLTGSGGTSGLVTGHFATGSGNQSSATVGSSLVSKGMLDAALSNLQCYYEGAVGRELAAIAFDAILSKIAECEQLRMGWSVFMAVLEAMFHDITDRNRKFCHSDSPSPPPLGLWGLEFQAAWQRAVNTTFVTNSTSGGLSRVLEREWLSLPPLPGNGPRHPGASATTSAATKPGLDDAAKQTKAEAKKAREEKTALDWTPTADVCHHILRDGSRAGLDVPAGQYNDARCWNFNANGRCVRTHPLFPDFTGLKYNADRQVPEALWKDMKDKCARDFPVPADGKGKGKGKGGGKGKGKGKGGRY